MVRSFLNSDVFMCTGALITSVSDRQVKYINAAFFEMFEIPESLHNAKTDHALTKHVNRMIVPTDGVDYDDIIDQMYLSPLSILAPLDLLDKRQITASSVPYEFEGELCRIWTYTDTTCNRYYRMLQDTLQGEGSMEAKLTQCHLILWEHPAESLSKR